MRKKDRKEPEQLKEIFPDNLLERTIRKIFPGMALERAKSRAKMAYASRWAGASRTSKTTERWNPATGDPSQDLSRELPDLQSRTGDLYRNSTIGGAAIETTVTNVVGIGLQLNSTLRSDILKISPERAREIENIIEYEFGIYSKYFEITNKLNFGDGQRLAKLQTLEKGECLGIFTKLDERKIGRDYKTRFQFLDTDRLINEDRKQDTDRMADGIERNKDTGRPEIYHIANKHPDNYTSSDEFKTTPVPAFSPTTGLPNVVHNYYVKFPGQNRGIPFLTPVVEDLKQITRYTKAELDAAVTQGMYSVLLESPSGQGDIQPGAAADLGGVNTGGPSNEEQVYLDYGLIVDLPEGYKPHFANPMRPNQQYESFFNANVAAIGSRLGIPFEFLMKRWQSSYSAAKASFVDAYKFFIVDRNWHANWFCQVIFERFMWEAVAIGKIPAPGFFVNDSIRQAYLSAEWYGPGIGEIDELKAVFAARERINEALSSRSEEAAKLGKNFDSVSSKLARDQEILEEKNITLKESGITINFNEGNDSDEDK